MTQPGKPQLDGVGCLLLLICWAFTWVSYEMYHWMRQEAFPSPSWFLFASASLAAVIIASVFLRGVSSK